VVDAMFLSGAEQPIHFNFITIIGHQQIEIVLNKNITTT